MEKPESALTENVFYKDGKLYVDEIEAESVAKEYGTPSYLYSLKRVVDSYKKIYDSFSSVLPSVSVHYSLKANANVSIVKALLAAGSGIDCVSAGEVHRALRCGCSPDHIVFAGVGKDVQELEYAMQHKIGWFNVENKLELEHLNCIAATASRTDAKIALRVNPSVMANTHPAIATGYGGAKFGMDIETIVEILKNKSQYPNLQLVGVHVHIGSQLGETKQTVEAVQKVLNAIAPFEFVTNINMGGGFPAKYCGQTTLPFPKDFATAVAPLLQKYHVMLEPGRSIVGEAGILLTKSLYRKDQGGQQMLIVDASMTDNMRPALYDAYHALVPLQQAHREEETSKCMIVGPVCESTDILAKEAPVPKQSAEPGHYFAMLTSGAYCASMATNYNQRSLAPQIVVTVDGKCVCSRKKQTFEDLEKDDLDW